MVGLDTVFAGVASLASISCTGWEVVIGEDDLGTTKLFKDGLCHFIALFYFEGGIAGVVQNYTYFATVVGVDDLCGDLDILEGHAIAWCNPEINVGGECRAEACFDDGGCFWFEG